ncbi:MAG: hypothetical protein QFB86_00370 [Patescibacteria group bacterium]|nr:hypothetical protein [Patescibacteria group bacterium]
MQIVEEFEGRFVADVVLGEQIGVGTGNINAGEWTSDRETTIEEGIKRNLVSVDPYAPSCCIDGRGCVSCLNGEPTEPRHPVAGGALVTAYAAAELIGWFGDTVGTSREKLERIDRLLRTAGITTGGHCDDAAAAVAFKDPTTGIPKTGCGADDKLPEIVLLPYTEKETVFAITAALLGEEYDTYNMQFVDEYTVKSQTKGWLPTDIIEVISEQSGKNIEILKSESDATHGHKEAALVVIYTENVTVDRDTFVAETGEQVFVVNIAYIEKIARALATGPAAVKQYTQLKHAMVAYQAATYLKLCDGSQRIITVT